MKKIIALLLSMITAWGMVGCIEMLDESSDLGAQESIEASSSDLESENSLLESFVDSEETSEVEEESSVLDSEETSESDEDDTVDILIVERRPQEADALVGLLETTDYEIERKCVQDATMPSSLAEICRYDEVMLHNIAYKDMPDGFDGLLEMYVQEYGGGVLTLGGKDENGEQNAYRRDDMFDTTYERILPVSAMRFTPPKGIVWLLDDSGSMTAMNNLGATWFDVAKKGIVEGLSEFSERDYVGLVTLSVNTALDLTPRTNEMKIREVIYHLENSNGGTAFVDAIVRAGQMLKALPLVEKKHAILVTDGVSSDVEMAAACVEDLREQEITFSVLLISEDENETVLATMQNLAQKGGGVLYTVKDENALQMAIKEDLNAPALLEYEILPFNPTVTAVNSPIVEGITETSLSVQLGGLYTTRVKLGAEAILLGAYDLPVYAQWSYGEGKVGSFTCDFGGEWSAEFIESEDGKRIFYNIVAYLQGN